jgi:hypothetical protein
MTANNGAVVCDSLAASLTTGTVFGITTDNCDGASLSQDGTCTIDLYMSCAAAGSPTDTLSVASDASDSPKTLSLSGTVSSGGDPLSVVGFETAESFPDASGGDVDLYNGGSGYQGWNVTVSGEVFVTASYANAGTQSLGLLGNNASPNSIYKALDSSAVSDFWLDYYVYATDTADNLAGLLTVTNSSTVDTTSSGPYLRIAGNNIQYYSGFWSSIVGSIADSTWYHVQLLVHPSATDCYFDLWLDGTEYNNSGSHYACVANIDAFTYIGTNIYNSAGVHVQAFDDPQAYVGSRK